jgi:hypothetical protein
MQVGKLTLPGELAALIDRGSWPRTLADASRQNLTPLVSADIVRTFASDENTIVLYPPPFHTVQDELDHGRGLNPEQLAVHDIVPDRTVVIADFGPGSDTALALDYRDGSASPSVIRLRWELPSRPNRWVKVADSFGQFWRMLDVA